MNFVYYPCAGFDGSVVKVFNNRYDFFIYVDQCYNKKDLNNELNRRGFRGYKMDGHFFVGKEFKSFNVILAANFTPTKITKEEKDQKGFKVIFIKGDGIEVLKKLIETKLEPIAIAYIRPGISFGSNRSTYPNEFIEIVSKNNGIQYLISDWGLETDIPKLKETYSKLIGEIRASTDMEDNLKLSIRERKI